MSKPKAHKQTSEERQDALDAIDAEVEREGFLYSVGGDAIAVIDGHARYAREDE